MINKSLKMDLRWISIATLIMAVALWRSFISDGSTFVAANFTPIGAMALFSGAHFYGRVSRYLFPVIVLLISDIVLGFKESGFSTDNILYDGWFWVYLAFIVAVFFGEKIANHIRFTTIASASVGTALVHWLLSDFGFWLTGGINVISGLPFEQSVEGLMTCYTLGFPFFLKLAGSTLLYSLMLFGSYFFLKRLRSSELAIQS